MLTLRPPLRGFGTSRPSSSHTAACASTAAPKACEFLCSSCTCGPFSTCRFTTRSRTPNDSAKLRTPDAGRTTSSSDPPLHCEHLCRAEGALAEAGHRAADQSGCGGLQACLRSSIAERSDQAVVERARPYGLKQHGLNGLVRHVADLARAALKDLARQPVGKRSALRLKQVHPERVAVVGQHVDQEPPAPVQSRDHIALLLLKLGRRVLAAHARACGHDDTPAGPESMVQINVRLESLLARPAKAKDKHTHRQFIGGRRRLAIVPCHIGPILGECQLKCQQRRRPGRLAGLGLGAGKVQKNSEQPLGEVSIQQRLRCQR
eukprot:scaffold12989_cov147-Isochrysis_galbana.AAC.1